MAYIKVHKVHDSYSRLIVSVKGLFGTKYYEVSTKDFIQEIEDAKIHSNSLIRKIKKSGSKIKTN